ncbi:unnamed protein product [Clonostachys rosea f. rosea IK726]|uniref:Uncharacterized protein n=1 Tax=Clonostachys rosea f. rosea IK726 TaxID=1349383 RepID=A0ACA9TCQ5_BIOOC|nr:unnamed protein product [Clonostachys rosea f. rosea IK726]
MALLPLDPYKILGVASDASMSDIKPAWRKLVLKCHPDKFPDPEVKEVQMEEFQRIQTAYELLSNDSARADYDRMVAVREHRAKVASSSNSKAPPWEVKSGDRSDSGKDNIYAYQEDIWEGYQRRERGTEKQFRARSRVRPPSQNISLSDERQEFVAYALQLFDEAKKQNLTTSDNNTTAFKSNGSFSHSSIEEQIKQRNKAFEKSKANIPRNSPPSQPQGPSKKAKHATTDQRTKKLQVVPVEQLNLEVMNPGIPDGRVDIVAVHGLGAIPDITWKEKTSSINWLSHKDMLPQAVPEARILRFGYDSLWMGETLIRTSLSTIAYNLLLSLNMMRVEDLERPLIFIGHCFGGLVIERALNLAKMRQEKYPGLFDSSVGVVFLGTPHRGSRSFTRESALLAAIAASSDLSKHLETSVLDTMTSDTGSLLDVSDDFITLCTDGGPEISCFFEQRSSKLGKVVGRTDITEFIVDAASATFDGHPKHGLEVDHFSLNKFNGPTNSHYLQVRAEIPTSERLRPYQSSQKVVSAAASQVSLEEEVLRREAVKELREEESRKKAIIQEEDYQKRLAKEKRAMELAFLERLKKNMSKYGIDNPGAILEENPLPKDEELKGQEIKEKNAWHLNYLKGALADTGVDGGQIDEILNDNGETMVIDGVETTVTRMSKKWVSKRTLNAYEIPWKYDEGDVANIAKNDSLAIIVKRWVPDYEQAFLWDHSMALRGDRGRKQHRYQDPPKTHEPSRKFLQQMYDIFKSGQKRMPSQDQTRRRAGSYDLKSFETREVRYSSARGKARERERGYYNASPKAVRNSSTPSTPATDRGFRRSQSYESVHSAPDSEELARRRRHSRTLSDDRSKGRNGPKYQRDSSGEKGSSARYTETGP